MSNSSSKPKYLRALEATSYIAIIAICCTLLYQHFFLASQLPEIPYMEIGDQHESLKSIVPAGKDEVLVFAISPNCPYCEKSMPFYQKLVRQRQAHGVSLPIIAAIEKNIPIEEERQMLIQHQVEVDTLLQLNTVELKIAAVPTMFLVSSSGEIKEVWRGYQDEAQQQEILDKLF